MQERAAELMEQVRSMFKDTTDILQTMDLVDSIQLLGLSYHFEKEISEALNRVHDADLNDHALYDTALRFRLLRQQGYHVTPGNTLGRFLGVDVFMYLTSSKMRIVSTLKDDPKGLLSLYNAAYLRIHEETILDEAISFTRDQLASMLSDLTPPLATQVRLFLESPLCRRMKRLLARNYISIYQEWATRNDALLELAKLDFNLLQCLHYDEIKSISIWWNDLFLSKNLSFARDRVVECYYWILAVYFEPHYSRARVITTKVMAMTSILDDIYDLYSTLEESQLLTQAIQRWDAKAVHQLPEYMKGYFLNLIDSFKEFENLLAPSEKYRLFYLKEACLFGFLFLTQRRHFLTFVWMKGLSRSYLEENKWAVKQYVPKLEEHLQISLISSAYPMLICASFVGMGEVATKEAFEWVASFPKIIKASALIARIANDFVSHELEQTREHVASTIQCYMKEFGTNVHVACENLQVMVEDAWKDVNEECLNPTAASVPLLERIVNFLCLFNDIYKDIDGYTNSSTYTRDNISLLLVHPIEICSCTLINHMV
ncbi:hypothetical protein C4D60_Mb00t07620 [Musa balbisiana]|uniref:Terpene synthase N-terminal domain-containing protein n=1 Tax=Musa balbisiana TaxID=52838 RepID=A0A4S8I5Y9_MUSBA|nr:hypothetical protein C4D60_Mb00t07620 [Musa balbisiana]